MSEFPELAEFARKNRNEIANTDYSDSCLFIRLFDLINKIAILQRDDDELGWKLLHVNRYKIYTVSLKTRAMVKTITIYDRLYGNIYRLELRPNKIILRPMNREPVKCRLRSMPKGFNFMEELRPGKPDNPTTHIEEETPLYEILNFDIPLVKSARN